MSAIDITALAERIAAQLEAKPSPLLTAEEAAALLSVPPSWLMAEARAKRVPHVKLGKYVRFSRDELLAWVDSRSAGPRGAA